MLLITCPFGLASLLTTELKRLGYMPKDVFPNGCRIDTHERTDIYRLNLHLRIANKVFWEVGYGLTTTFEHLFETIQVIDWKKYISPGQGFVVSATSQESALHSLPTLQSITQKAIATRLTGTPDAHWHITDTIPPAEIYLYLHRNQLHVTINTSGRSLHQRGWRVDQGEAPIKENLAVATLLLASWPFHQPLRDPCCGSGTLLIEAARLAKNIAAGSNRAFAFQHFPDFDAITRDQLRQTARAQELDKSWTLIGSDIDDHILSIAKQNAEQGQVSNLISFAHHDILLPTKLPALQGPTTVICNPPYGQRLTQAPVEQIHQRLAQLILQPGRNGAVITGYEKAEDIFTSTHWKRKETRQGKEPCFIYIPKKSTL